MRNLQLLYSSKEQFGYLVSKSDIDVKYPSFVRVYLPNHLKEDAKLISEEIADILPNAKIIGCSTNGVIFHGKQYNEDVLVMLEQFDDTDIITGIVDYSGKSPSEVVREIKNTIANNKVKLMHVFCGSQWIDVNEFIDEMNIQLPSVRLTGGIAGCDLDDNKKPYVIKDNDVQEPAIVFAGYINDELNVFCDANISHEPISGVYTMNKVKGKYLVEIENIPATDWCFEQFGIQKLTELKYWKYIADNDELTKFPLILEGHHGVSRFVHFDAKKNMMSFYQMKVPANSSFRIGYVSPTKCVKECYDICMKLSKEPVETLFCYSCVFRKLYLENCAEWELKPFKDANICGAFMLGEISWNQERNESFNGSCVYIGIAEKESYINPDFSVFDDLFRVHTDDDKLVNFVLKKQSQAMTQENKMLLDKLLDQQEKSKTQLFHDSITGMGNSIKYSNDKKEIHFNKMCLIQIENFNLLVSRLGQDSYHDLLSKASKKIIGFLNNILGNEKFYYYMLNDSTMFIAAGANVSNEDFVKHIDFVYDHFQTIHFENINDILINRFILLYKDKDLLETGILALKECQNLQTHYVNFNELNINGGKSLEEEEKILNVLNYAINNDTITPYFQGIFDNRNKWIRKYEALMRIVDENGKVYIPSDFMSIAKKYHLYAKLSTKMIEKVFNLFEGTDIEVSINLSAYDISYNSVSDFIISRLSNMKKCDNFVFEILEDESFSDLQVLKKFLDEVRRFGVKIAIDDFGIGYSNFMAIAQIAPDYIKIDGSIVKNIMSDELCKKVLENIVFLGKQLEVQIIAEFVENNSIQEEIERHQIHYSQGYCFSRPSPFNALDLS